MPGSLLVVHYETSTGQYFFQKVGSTGIADAAVVSGKIASGAIGVTELIADGIVASAKLTSAIISLLGSVADKAITSAKLASGAVIGDRIANAGIFSGKIASGAIIADAVADYGILSGKYASGSITEGALVSGISIDIAEVGQEPTYRAEVPISGFLAIQFSVSGYYSHAQAADINTIPAIGVLPAFVNSGQIGAFQYAGRLTNAGWNFSGYVGSLLFTGTSSEVTLMVSGLMVSGRCVQRLGKVADADTIFLKPELTFAQVAE